MFFLLMIAVSVGSARAECRDGTIIDSGLACEQKQLIVDTHNKLRNRVAAGEEPTQPKAANMLEMRWCDDVAETAQDWADQCTFEHNVEKEVDGHRVGQNLAMKWGKNYYFSTDDLEGMINDWYNEVKEHGYNGTFSPDSGHYSQVIWGSSNCVGCGFAFYEKEGSNYTYLVCNYLPAGNVIGDPPYEYGDVACESHGFNKSSSYEHLCAIDNKKVQACDNEIDHKPKTRKSQEDEATTGTRQTEPPGEDKTTENTNETPNEKLGHLEVLVTLL